MAQHALPASAVTLDFRSDQASGPAAAEVLRGDLSACDMTGSCLWLGCDETTTVERLITRDGIRFAEHRAFSLGLDDFEKITINAMKSAFIPHNRRIQLIYDVIKPGYEKARAPIKKRKR